MRILNMLLLFTSIAACCAAQDATLYHRDGAIIKTRVTATSDKQIFTNNGTYDWDVIDSLRTDNVTLREQCASKQPFKMSSGPAVFVNGVNINSLEIQYVSIVATGLFLSTRVVISVDYGQRLALGEQQRIQGPDGKVQKFNGVIDALNFMYKNGWEYRDAYTVDGGFNQKVFDYTLQRKR